MDCKLKSGGKGGTLGIELRNVREQDCDLANPAVRRIVHRMEKSLGGKRIRYQVPKFQAKVTYQMPGRLTRDDLEDLQRECAACAELKGCKLEVQPVEKKAPQLAMLYCEGGEGRGGYNLWNVQVNKNALVVHEWYDPLFPPPHCPTSLFFATGSTRRSAPAPRRSTWPPSTRSCFFAPVAATPSARTRRRWRSLSSLRVSTSCGRQTFSQPTKTRAAAGLKRRRVRLPAAAISSTVTEAATSRGGTARLSLKRPMTRPTGAVFQTSFPAGTAQALGPPAARDARVRARGVGGVK